MIGVSHRGCIQARYVAGKSALGGGPAGRCTDGKSIRIWGKECEARLVIIANCWELQEYGDGVIGNS